MIKQTTLWRLLGLLVLLIALSALSAKLAADRKAAATAKKGKEGFELTVAALKELNPPGCPCKASSDCASFRCRRGKCANVFGVVPRYGDPVCYQIKRGDD
jgi:hypothetical protein